MSEQCSIDVLSTLSIVKFLGQNIEVDVWKFWLNGKDKTTLGTDKR